jgi:two-component system phosphate regulon sensor histidine kinase PhoR
LKKRIFVDMILLTVISLVLVAAALCFVFYNQFSGIVKSELRQRADLFRNAGTQTALQELSIFKPNDMRITLIHPDGTVAFDNAVGTAGLANHLDREEIAEAVETGWGESRRLSATLGRETYYYAVRLADGVILRVAKTTSSIWGMFSGVLPAVICVIFVILAAGYVVAGNLIQQREHIAAQFSEKMMAEQMRREFSANVSHELKTPLTSIYGHAEMLYNGMVKESDHHAFFGKIKDEAARLIALIEDIILISKLDENTGQETFEAVSLAAIAAEAAEALSLKADEHRVAVSVSGDASMLAGRSMVYELFYNLIDNAIKYNKPGGTVKVDISQIEDKIEIAVADTGIGIPVEAQSRVFERFYRVDKSRSKKTGGTGLGLAIVKHIVLLHKGHMALQSAEGQGTVVRISFLLH